MTFINGPALLNSAIDRDPRIGGTVEDETGWWHVDDIVDGYAWLTGRDGMERMVKVGNLGHVTLATEAR